MKRKIIHSTIKVALIISICINVILFSKTNITQNDYEESSECVRAIHNNDILIKVVGLQEDKITIAADVINNCDIYTKDVKTLEVATIKLDEINEEIGLLLDQLKENKI